MKPGSIVVCVRADFKPSPFQMKLNIKFPKLHNPYIIRGIENFGGSVGVHLEEIVNPIIPEIGFEIYFNIEAFREIDPMDISELLEVMEAVEV